MNEKIHPHYNEGVAHSALLLENLFVAVGDEPEMNKLLEVHVIQRTTLRI